MDDGSKFYGDSRTSLLSSSFSEEEGIHLRPSAPCQEDLNVSLTNLGTFINNKNHSPTNIREFLLQNKSFYKYSCLTGVIWPEEKDNAENSVTKHNLRYRIWSTYLHTMLTFSTLLIIAAGIYNFKTQKRPNTAIIVCETLGISMQNILLYPVIVYLRRELTTKREINTEEYTEAFEYGIIVGRRVFIILMICLIIYSIIVVNVEVSTGSFSGESLAFSLLFFMSLTPTQYFISGILTFLIVEQRISMKTMKFIVNQAKEQVLTSKEYLKARESIDARDRQTPINLLLGAAMINSILGLVLVFTLSGAHYSLEVIFIDIFYSISIFSKQIIVLVIVLLEIVKVNEKNEILLHCIAKYEWSADKENQRLSLYIMAKEFPMGSTIFFIRPSKRLIYIHIASVIISAFAAVFWALAL